MGQQHQPTAQFDLVLGAWVGPEGREEWTESTKAPADQQAVPARAADILVVEDEHIVALDLQERLEASGHHTDVVYSGEAAVERALQKHFDLILMDIKLGPGGIDGVDAARRIREETDVPIIYVTAYADSHTLDRARLTEPYGYILKPFQERELHAAIEMALQRHDTDARRTEEMELQAFLAQASDQLASTLDYQGVLSGASGLVVPRYADWCLVCVDAPDSPIQPSYFVHPNGAELHPWTRDPRGGLIESVLKERRSLLVGADARALGEQLGLGHIEVPPLGACSLFCIPIGARERTLGVFAVALRHDRELGEGFAWVEDFVHRLGMALDNALLYRKAQQALQMRNEVLAIVSHDLRNPLGAIILRAQSLAGMMHAAPIGNAILVAARRMNRLVGDLLDASSINTGHLTLDKKPWKATELLDEAIQLLRPDADAAGVSLVSTLTRDNLRLECDRDRILQVLTNLIANAIRYTPRGGSITLSGQREEDRLAISVRDTGSGIPPDHLPHLFERFWRGAHDHPGAGLGLYVCQGIVEAHGGAIRAESEPGAGATFTFSVPIAPDVWG